MPATFGQVTDEPASTTVQHGILLKVFYYEQYVEFYLAVSHLLPDIVDHASVREYAQASVDDPLVLAAQKLDEDVEVAGPLDELLATLRITLELIEAGGDAALITRAEVSRQHRQLVRRSF